MMSDVRFSLDKLVAHRGLQLNYPENTALSLAKAVEFGGLFIELDIQFSSDCLPIIYHDADLQRVSGQSGNICDYSRDQLLQLPAFEPERLGNRFKSERIAPIEAIVNLLKNNPQVTAFVELKEESIAHCGRETMLAEVEAVLEPVKHQTVIISYDYLLVLRAREHHWPKVGVVLKQWHDIESDIVKNTNSGPGGWHDQNKSDLFIMPSIVYKKSIEGFGISFIEAGSYGVGSIGGKDGGSSDAIMDNKSGILCDGNDLGSIYDSINQFFENDNYLKYGKAAKDFSEKFYWEKTIKKYLELLES